MNLAKAAVYITALSITTTLTAAQTELQPRQGKTNVPHGQDQIFFRADKLVGRSAQTPVGHELGKLQDIAFNQEKGIYGIVKAENDRLVALPWSLVTAVTEKAVVFNTSSQAMSQAPSFTDKQWTKLNDSQFTQKLDSHFGQGAMGGSASEASQSASGAAASSQEQTPQSTEAQGGSSSLEATNAPSQQESSSDTNSPSASDTNSASQ